jgi:hypothetical protein
LNVSALKLKKKVKEATMRSKKLFQVVAMAVTLIFIGAAGVMAQGTASTPISDGGITPYIIDKWSESGIGKKIPKSY